MCLRDTSFFLPQRVKSLLDTCDSCSPAFVGKLKSAIACIESNLDFCNINLTKHFLFIVHWSIFGLSLSLSLSLYCPSIDRWVASFLVHSYFPNSFAKCTAFSNIGREKKSKRENFERERERERENENQSLDRTYRVDFPSCAFYSF